MKPGAVAALRRVVGASCVFVGLTLGASGVSGQLIQGRLLDAENGAPVALAGVFILSADREVLVGSASDTSGLYSIAVPGDGEFYLFVQRLGYFENETPLFRAEADRTYSVDIEMRPEPFRMDPLSVTVRNEELEDFLTLQLGENPNGLFGYRVHQGIALQEAKLGATDNTEILRRLYVWISHGQQVCIGAVASGGASFPPRDGASPRRDPDTGVPLDPRTGDVLWLDEMGGGSCGALYLDGYRVPNEHVETVEMESVAVVVTLPGSVRLYTRGFDWTMRPGSGEDR